MFISRKRFEEEIEKAKKEVTEKFYTERDLNDRFQYMNRDIGELARRVSDLESKINEDVKTNRNETATFFI